MPPKPSNVVGAKIAVKPRAPVPVLALSVEDACTALGVSWKTWREHIEPDVRVVRVGRCKRVAVSELQRWLEQHADRAGVSG